MPRLNKGFSCLNMLQICDFEMNEENQQTNLSIVQVAVYRKWRGTELFKTQ